MIINRKRNNLNPIEMENQFKSFLTNFGFTDLRVFESYKRFRIALEKEIFASNFNDSPPSSAANLESKLWKICHYKYIEDFRKAFKQAIVNRRKSVEDANHYSFLILKFRELLVEAQSFYLNFISKIYFLFGSTYVSQSIINDLNIILIDHSDILSKGSALKTQNRPTKERIQATLYRTLISLGDIARYRDSTVDKGNVQFGGQYSLAKKYYWHALCLVPGNGNPYNQLAVLEAYCDRFTFALDLYFKSLCVPNPFGVSMSNLGPLFTKAAQKKSKTVESTFVLLISKLLDPAKNILAFETDSPSILSAISQWLDEDNGVEINKIDILESILSSCLGLLHLITNSLFPSENSESTPPLLTQENQSQHKALVGDGRFELASFTIGLCNIILTRFATVLSADFEAVEGAYEPFLRLIALTIKSLLHPWMFNLVCEKQSESAAGTRNSASGAKAEPRVSLDVGIIWRSVARAGTLIARVMNERYPHADIRDRPVLIEDQQKEFGCAFVAGVFLADPDAGVFENKKMEDGEIVRIRFNQILFGIKSLCLKEPTVLYEHTLKGILTFSVSPPAPESANSTPIHPPQAFEGGWRSGASLSGMSASSPFSPTAMKSGDMISSGSSMNIDPSAHHVVAGGGAVDGDAQQINMTLSYLGLGTSPLHPTTPKFILPESSVKRVPTTMVSRPVPIGSVLNPKSVSARLNSSLFPGPVNGNTAATNAKNGYHMQALFPDNPFMPGIQLASFTNHTKFNNNSNSYGANTGYAGGNGQVDNQSVQVPAASSFDALFARLTPYQQSMVSPVVNPSVTASSMFNNSSTATFLIPRDEEGSAPNDQNQFFQN